MIGWHHNPVLSHSLHSSSLSYSQHEIQQMTLDTFRILNVCGNRMGQHIHIHINKLLFSSPGNWGSGGGQRGAGVRTPASPIPLDTMAAEHLFYWGFLYINEFFFRLVIAQTTRRSLSSSTCFCSIPPPLPLCVTSKRDKMACFFL